MIQNSFKLILVLSNGEILEELSFSETFDIIFDAIENACGLSMEFSREDFAKGSLIYHLDEEDVFSYIKSLHGDKELLNKHIKQIKEEKEKASKQIQEEKEKAIQQLKEENENAIKHIQEEKEKAIEKAMKQIQEEKEEKEQLKEKNENAIKQLKKENEEKDNDISLLKMQLSAKETFLKKSKNLSKKPTYREEKKKQVFRPKASVNEGLNDAIAVLSDPNSSEDEKKKAQRFLNAYNRNQEEKKQPKFHFETQGVIGQVTGILEDLDLSENEKKQKINKVVSDNLAEIDDIFNGKRPISLEETRRWKIIIKPFLKKHNWNL